MSEKCLNKKRTHSQDKSLIKPTLYPHSTLSLEKSDKGATNNIKLIKNNIGPKVLSKKQKLNLKQFEYEVSKLNFCPIGSNANFSGNYDNYLGITLSHISKMTNINFDYALESPSIYENFPKNVIERLSLSDKKILVLDLDETLIHADFDEEFSNKENIKYDAKISFYSEENSGKREKFEKDEDDESILTDDDSKDLSNSKILNTVGIFLRPGVKQFLEEVSKYFEVGIFTASVPEYADAVINYLDPENKYIKFRLYRNNCINVKDLLRVKNLKIFQNIPLKKIILVDNNMYSFAPQLNNGILINSFTYDKDDNELSNVLSYLLNYILPAEDVRKVNEQFFGFKKIVDEMITNEL
jgi:Dullard-like phosphatase family protein